MSGCADVEAHLGQTLTKLGFTLEAADEAVVYGGRPAWAVYYRGIDCKLQVCWSAREGGIDFMLAPLDAPNEFGLSSRSNGWEYMLMLSESDDGLQTPSLEESDEVWWRWREALLVAHVREACAALLSGQLTSGSWIGVGLTSVGCCQSQLISRERGALQVLVLNEKGRSVMLPDLDRAELLK